ALAGELITNGIVAILVVAHNRKARMGQMNPNLVGAAGFQLCLHQGKATKATLHGDDGMRRLASRVNLDTSLAAFGQPAQQGKTDVLTVVYPIALHQRPVKLAGTDFTEHIVQADQSRTTFGNNRSEERRVGKEWRSRREQYS